MGKRGSYMPPLYVPLGQSDAAMERSDSSDSSEDDSEAKDLKKVKPVAVAAAAGPPPSAAAGDPVQWSSGICACFDDMPSCCIGAVCPCYLFGKNAEFLGSGTLAGSCMTHFLLWGLLNCACCMCTGGILSIIPGASVACYACNYRKTLRAKYNLQEAPCGDLSTHVFCHLCAICQEYREIRERSDGSGSSLVFPATAPTVQKMEPN